MATESTISAYVPSLKEADHYEITRALLFCRSARFRSLPLQRVCANTSDQNAIERTSAAIRSAFAKSDVAEVMKYLHPNVNKALSFQKVLIGRDAVASDLRETFKQFHLEFVDNRVESLLIENDTAVEQTLFSLKGTPKSGGEPFVYKGRAMVVYVRYKQSPTGWASIREVIQPASN